MSTDKMSDSEIFLSEIVEAAKEAGVKVNTSDAAAIAEANRLEARTQAAGNAVALSRRYTELADRQMRQHDVDPAAISAAKVAKDEAIKHLQALQGGK